MLPSGKTGGPRVNDEALHQGPSQPLAVAGGVDVEPLHLAGPRPDLPQRNTTRGDAPTEAQQQIPLGRRILARQAGQFRLELDMVVGGAGWPCVRLSMGCSA